MEKLTLKKNGTLELTYWHCDEDSEEGFYKKECVGFPTVFQMHNVPFFFEKGATLRSLFKYMWADRDLWSIHLGENAKDFIVEGLLPAETPQKLDYLECYWCVTYDTFEGEKELEVPNFMWLHGFEEGDDNTYSISFLKTNEISNIPVIINSKWTLTHSYLKDDKYVRDSILEDDVLPNMFQVVYGIFYELGWYGAPEKRDEEGSRLNKAVGELDNMLDEDFGNEDIDISELPEIKKP